MTTENILITLNKMNNHLKVVKELVYDNCGLVITNLKSNMESVEYGACSFELNGKKIEYRVSKITPTKNGQFVTIWKRNNVGITEPFAVTDSLDFIIITVKSDENFGQFVFPKAVLANHGIVKINGKDGKRGIRVYPPWDIAVNKQAQKTQQWQLKYFLTIKQDNTTDLDLTQKLFTLTN